MSDERHLPAFGSEAEEAQWWFDNREARGEEFAAAIREGHVSDGSKRRIAVAASTPIKLCMDDARIALLLATKAGQDYSAYLRELIHDALLRKADSLNREEQFEQKTPASLQVAS